MATKPNFLSNLLPAITAIPGNALNDAGNMLNGFAKLPDMVNNAVANPQTIPGTLGTMATGAMNEFNQFAGDPLHNLPLIGIQTPQQSLKQGAATIQHAQQHPLNTALDAATLVQGANAFQPRESTVGNAVENIGKKLTTDVNKIQLSPSLGGAAKEQAVQNTVNNLVPGLTAEEKYANLQPTMRSLSDNIDSELSANPKSVPIQDVKNAFMGNLSDQFRTKGLTSERAANEVNDYINSLFKDTAEPVPENTVGSSLPPIDPSAPGTTTGQTVNGSKYVRMGGVGPGIQGPPGYLKQVNLPTIGDTPEFATENPTSPYNPKPMGDIIPHEISTKDLFQMKVGANQDYQNVLRKINSGAPLTDTDKVIAAARKTLDDIIAYEHPNVKTMTLQQSNLFDAIKPLADARNANHSFNLLGTTVPKEAGKFLKGAGGQVLKNAGKIIKTANPETTLTLAGEAANALGSMPVSTPQDISSKSYNDESNNPPDHTGSILSQSYSNIKPDNQTGHFELPQTPPAGANNRHYMTTADYQGGLQKLAQQYPAGDRDPAYSVAKTQLDSQFGNDQKQADEVFKGNNVKNFMDNATQYNNEGKDLLNTMLTLPTGFWNGVKQAGSIRAYSDPQYQQQIQQIDSFNNEYASAYESVTGKTPTDNQLLSAANSPEQAAKKYTSMMQFISGTYGKYLEPYLALTSATGTQTTQGTPQGMQSLPPITAPQQQSAAGMMQQNFPVVPPISLPPIQ